MAFCDKCGTKLDENSKFCPNCGSPYKEAEKNPASKRNRPSESLPLVGENGWLLTSVVAAVIVGVIGIMMMCSDLKEKTEVTSRQEEMQEVTSRQEEMQKEILEARNDFMASIEDHYSNLKKFTESKKLDEALAEINLFKQSLQTDYKDVAKYSKIIQTELLLEKVKKLPVSNAVGNLTMYKQLLSLNPEKEIYKNKVDFYTRKIRQTDSPSVQPTKNPSVSVNWKKIANDLVKDYKGDIIAIEQLNSSTCWAVLSSNISNTRAIEIAENIGFYVRNVTGVLQGYKPSIHVFRNGQHIAVARVSGNGFVGKLELENWDPSSFNGEYRP